jgi:hypothetical protein
MFHLGKEQAMKQLKLLLALPVLAVALMGASCDAKLQNVLVQTCDGLKIAYAHYDAVAESGVLSARVIQRVAVVRQQTDALCANPGSATTVTVTAIAAKAYLALNAAFREGGNTKEARLGYTKVQGLRTLLEKAKE